MRKIIILLVTMLLIVGCGRYGENSVVNDLDKKINNLNTYRVYGKLEITNNDEVYSYNVDVSYKKKDYYKVSLTNTNNNHTQIILKNKDSVYVVTPSLNKSFKFQSDWPYDNSQIYLLGAISNDIKNDKNRKFKERKDKYIFTTKVDYPNNKNLVKQKIILDKKLNIKSVRVYDKNNSIVMKMIYTKINYSPRFNNKYFDLNSVVNRSSKENISSKKVSNLDEGIYPLVVPNGTKLVNEEKIKKDIGERIIMTFDGRKPFLLVEETSNSADEFTVVPTYGKPYRLMDTLGVMTDNSLSWSSNGIDYYLVSNVLKQDELIEVAQSINLVKTMK